MHNKTILHHKDLYHLHQSTNTEFMSHHAPTYSHSVDPLDADDWLNTINKKLNIT
jgi:hypothetical protein